MENKIKNFTITEWAEEDRPREKLMNLGRHNLTDAELIGILLGSGNTEQNAVELARDILISVKNNLNELALLTVSDLTKFRGIGEAKAITIVSALELGRRRKESEVLKKPKITCSNDAYTQLKGELLDLAHEEFWILCLNQANTVIAKKRISTGGVAGTVVDAKVVFRSALDTKAVSLILAHNHPSGNLNPSQQDLSLTKKLKEAGETLDLRILDHLIFTNASYYSFADEGLI